MVRYRRLTGREYRFGSWVVVPEGAAKGDSDTCRQLVLPRSSSAEPSFRRRKGWTLTKPNAEIGNEAPAEHLRSCQLLLIPLARLLRLAGQPKLAAIDADKAQEYHVRQ
jgi:hypothetical protein